MIAPLLADMPSWPSSENLWEFLGLCVILMFQTYQIQLAHGLKFQLNGRLDALIRSSWEEAHATGQILGAAREQDRVRTQLEAANTAAQDLAQVLARGPGPIPPAAPPRT